MTPKLYVATPLDHGQIHMATAVTMFQFFSDPNFVIAPNPDGSFNEDVYRVRSRIAAKFLETDCTHLFFLDSDVSAPPVTLQKLVAAQKPIVAAPYPKKHYRLLPNYEPSWYPMGETVGEFQPALCPMGCTLIERAVIEAVSGACVAESDRREAMRTKLHSAQEWLGFDAYQDAINSAGRSATVFYDIADKKLIPCTFAPIIGGNPRDATMPPNMWPEDMSFCMRANALGFGSFMHMGTTAYHHDGNQVFPMMEVGK